MDGGAVDSFEGLDDYQYGFYNDNRAEADFCSARQLCSR